MAKAELTIVLPGLATIIEQQINATIIPPYLAKIMSHSRFAEDTRGLSRLLFNHFSEKPQTGSDLPLVHLETGDTRCLRIDPCYLVADRDRLLLFTDDITLSRADSEAFMTEIQPLFTDFGGELRQSPDGHFLLQMESLPEVNFSALDEVSGKSVDAYLPKGNDRQDWIRLWNEVQMQLYGSEFNQTRIENKQLAINGIWFCGAGQCDVKESPWEKVQGQSMLLKQLANKSTTPFVEDCAFDLASVSAGQHLWLAQGINLDTDWLGQMQSFDETVLKPLWQACRSAKIASITLQIPEHGSYQLGILDSWKFW